MESQTIKPPEPEILSIPTDLLDGSQTIEPARYRVKDFLVRPYILALMIVGAGIATHAMAFFLHSNWATLFGGKLFHKPFAMFVPMYAINQFILFSLLGLLRDPRDRNRGALVGRSALAALLVEMVFLATLVAFNNRDFPRSVLLMSVVMNGAFIGGLLLFLRRITLKPLKVLLIGDDAVHMQQVQKKLEHSPRMARSRFHHHVIPTEYMADLVGNGKGMKLRAYIIEHEINEVVLVHRERPEDYLLPVLCHPGQSVRKLYVVPSLYDVVTAGRVEGFVAHDVRMLEVQSSMDRWDYRFLKRAMDLAAAVGIFVLALPVMALVGFAILVTMGRPIFYSQIRVGKYGKHFRIFKFRTMVNDAEKATGAVLTYKGDPRVTPIGRWLRVTRLDELPQLWNVLIGSMSLIGPRPERPELVAKIEKEISSYHMRHGVKPGLSGMAQIYGQYDSDAMDKLRFDLAYIYNYSFFLDIFLMARTGLKVMSGGGC